MYQRTNLLSDNTVKKDVKSSVSQGIQFVVHYRKLVFVFLDWSILFIFFTRYYEVFINKLMDSHLT